MSQPHLHDERVHGLEAPLVADLVQEVEPDLTVVDVPA